ncbi:MAG: hypothetical protein LUG49_06360 [Oscillospiraceae bacterium]|nr:hypothetical protein [Oscillospiraceae bacterium]
MKKFVSMAIALVMVLSLTVVAFADTTVASQDSVVDGVVTVLDGADFTDETLYLYIYFSVDDESYIGWGPAGICDSNWVTAIGYGTDYDLSVNADGYVAYALTDVAAAFAAVGSDPADGVILNWWADYATLTGVALVSTSDSVATVEDTSSAEEEVVEDTNVATEETTTTSPSTGVALALVPMAIAGIAVVSSKKR